MNNFFLLSFILFASCASLKQMHRAPSSASDADVYHIFDETYLADFNFGQSLGKEDSQNKSCLASIKEGQDLLAIYQKNRAYQGMAVPDALAIDGLLKRKALVFVVNMSVGEEGLAGVMSPFEGIDREGQPIAADFLHTNNRIIFGVLPLPDGANPDTINKSDALRGLIVVVKGPSLCGITGSYDSIAKVNVNADENGMELNISCGGDKYAQAVNWSGKFLRDQKLKYKFQLESFDYTSFAGQQVTKDGKIFRSINRKEKLIDLKCRGMKRLNIAT